MDQTDEELTRIAAEVARDNAQNEIRRLRRIVKLIDSQDSRWIHVVPSTLLPAFRRALASED